MYSLESTTQPKMGDVAVENPANTTAPHKKQAPSSVASITDSTDIVNTDGDEYATYKKLQRELEYIQLQEEYIKDEQRYALFTTVWLSGFGS